MAFPIFHLDGGMAGASLLLAAAASASTCAASSWLMTPFFRSKSISGSLVPAQKARVAEKITSTVASVINPARSFLNREICIQQTVETVSNGYKS